MGLIKHRLRLLKRALRFAKKDSRTEIILIVAVGWFLSIGMRTVYPVLLPDIRAAYGFDFRIAGLLISILWGAYALGQLPGGILSDQFGERVVLTTSTLFSAVALALVVVSGFTVVVFVTTALFGFATALYGVARYTVLSKVFPNHDGAAIGVTLAAGNIGNAILPMTAGAIAVIFSWREGLGLAVPLFVITTFFIWITLPLDSSEDSVSTFDKKVRNRLSSELRRPVILLVTAMLVLMISVWQTFTGFYPSYLIEIKGLPAATAVTVFSFFFSLAIVIQPLAGTVYDRIGVRQTLLIFLSLTTVGFILLPFVQTTGMIIAVTVLLACMTSVIAVTMPYLTSHLPERVQGTGLGLLRTGYMMVGAASPAIFGALAEGGYFKFGFSALGVLVIGMIVIVLRLPESS